MTWTLIGQSFGVLWKDKKLIVFPILSGLAGLAVAALFFLTVFGYSGFGSGAVVQDTWWRSAWVFAGYCLGSFVMVFFNCSLAACVQVRFAGGEPSIADGMGRAASRAGAILLWSLISSTVGLILNAVGERSGWLGKIAASIFGIAWGMATYLIVPVLVLEDQDVFAAIRRSTALLRKTWGQQVAYGLTFGWVTLLLMIPVFVLGAMAMNYFAWILPLAVLVALLAIAVMSAVRGVFVVALYRYATAGQAPQGYSQDLLNRAFRGRT